ncbi:MAG: TetR/AcrR family transcriptional regulator [Pseudomonadales bacterium]
MAASDASNSLYSMRKTPKQERSKATVEAILAAAIQVLLANGYDKASTYKIADIAGVSIGSLYEYFPGKEAIYAEVQRKNDRILFDHIMSQPEPGSIRELIRSHTTANLAFVRQNLELHAALINDVPQFALGQQEFRAYRDYLPWASQYFELHREELRQDVSTDRIVEFTVRVIRSTIDNYVLYTPEQLNDPVLEEMLIDLAERLVLRG